MRTISKTPQGKLKTYQQDSEEEKAEWDGGMRQQMLLTSGCSPSPLQARIRIWPTPEGLRVGSRDIELKRQKLRSGSGTAQTAGAVALECGEVLDLPSAISIRLPLVNCRSWHKVLSRFDASTPEASLFL